MKKMIPWFLTVLLFLLSASCFSGCTVMTQDQKDWIADKANRSDAFHTLMVDGRTTRAEEQAWITSQNAAWDLWRAKIENGMAAPGFIANHDSTALPAAATQPATTQAVK